MPLDMTRDKDRLDHLGYGHGKTPTLYVCSENACFPPVKPGKSLEKVRALLEKSRERKQIEYGR